MVSHDHLSAGNSISSSSRNLFAEYGISNPNSPAGPALEDNFIEAMVESDANPPSISLSPQESAPHPLAASVSSEDSSDLVKELEVNVGPVLGSDAQDIFRAAHYFSSKDREEALSERKRVMQLMDFISAHGLSINDVNAFISEGKIANVELARKVFDTSSPRTDGTPIAKEANFSHPSFLGGRLVQISCVGEAGIPERASLSPVSSPMCASPFGKKINPVILDLNPASTSKFGSELSPAGRIPNHQDGHPRTWSAIVSNRPERADFSLTYHPPSSTEGQILIKPPVEVLQRGNQLWASSLVGYFLQSKLPFKVVEPIARRLWGNKGLTNVYLHDKGFYIFKFQTVADRDNVLASGPWHFASKIIVLQPWKEGFEFSKSVYDKFPVWVKLSKIPLSYWSAEGISYIASGIGKPLSVDDMTAKLSIMNYARVCIEVDASFTFPSSINVIVMSDANSEGIVVPINVEYQSRLPSFPSCKVFGHSPMKCPKSNFIWVPKSTPADPPGQMADLPDGKICSDALGNIANNEWVTVSRGAKNGKESCPPNSLMVTSNSFSPIANPCGIQALSVVESPDAANPLVSKPGPLSPDSISPAVDNPLVNKLKAIDEKEGKDLKQKQRNGTEISQVAKKRSRGKGKVSNSSPSS